MVSSYPLTFAQLSAQRRQLRSRDWAPAVEARLAKGMKAVFLPPIKLLREQQLSSFVTRGDPDPFLAKSGGPTQRKAACRHISSRSTAACTHIRKKIASKTHTHTKTRKIAKRAEPPITRRLVIRTRRSANTRRMLGPQLRSAFTLVDWFIVPGSAYAKLYLSE